MNRIIKKIAEELKILLNKMKYPVKPSQEDCCNSGCNPCIFDLYDKKLKLYEKHLKDGTTSKDTLNGMKDLEYTGFTVMNKINIDKEHILLSFKNLTASHKVWWKAGQHFLVKYEDENTVCTRAYTPLHVQSVDSDADFCIVLKRYIKGLVSNYLFSLNKGDMSLWRGPYGSYEYKVNSYKRIIMIAQGTGVAPFHSIINEILNNDDDMTRVDMFICTKAMESLLLRNEWYTMKSFWNFTYRIFVAEPITMEVKYEEPVMNKKLCVQDFIIMQPLSEQDQCLICGSQEFMESYKKVMNELQMPSRNIFLF